MFSKFVRASTFVLTVSCDGFSRRFTGLVTATLYALATLPATFVAVTVNVYVAAVLGSPLSTPASVSVRFVGSAPAVTANVGAGLPEAAMVDSYITPATPAGVELVVMTGAAFAACAEPTGAMNTVTTHSATPSPPTVNQCRAITP